MLDFAKYKVLSCKLFANMMNGKTFVSLSLFNISKLLHMKQVFAAVLVLFAMVSFTACKKGGGAKSNTELLTQSAWKYDNASLDLDRNGTPDSPVPPGFLEACETDNTITFKSDGSGIADEGASKCDPASPQTSPFTWTFKNNDQVITFANIDFAGLNGDVKVVTLNDTKLELHKEVVLGPTAVNVIVYLKH